MTMKQVWAAIGGATVTIIVGFVWGGWSTASATQHKTEAAVLATRAAICVAQFVSQPNYQQSLKVLKETNYWERAALVEKGGWDKMPGETQANSAVSRACAEGLESLLPK
jgi:hypothetical protein